MAFQNNWRKFAQFADEFHVRLKLASNSSRRGGGRADFRAHDDAAAGGVVRENQAGLDRRKRRAAMASVKVAITVSPAPETSKTACACVGM